MTALALEQRLVAALDEPLRANFARWCAFVAASADEPIELQALGCKTMMNGGERNRFAHALSIDEAVALLAEAEERFKATGLYTIANRINPAVVTRAERGKWHEMAKGASTSDRDIVARRCVLVDLDVVRPSGTSATDEELALAIPVAIAARERLVTALGDDGALAYGHSGNGRQIPIALDGLAEGPEVATFIRDLLGRLRAAFAAPSVAIDVSVGDAKRLLPAFGTTKRKGAPGVAERPHRRTAIIIGDEPRRLSLDELKQLCDALPAATAIVAVPRAALAAGRPPTNPTSPFGVVNAWSVDEVATWLGLRDGDSVKCPGCGNISGVGIVGNGLKCMHASCAGKGVPGNPGFRTPVDLVMEVRGVKPREAVDLIAERFGIALPAREPTVRRPVERVRGDDDHRVDIVVTDDADRVEELQVANQVLHALRVDTSLFHRGGMLVDVTRDMTGAPRIRELPLASLRERISAVARFHQLKSKKDGDVCALEQPPPDWCVRAIHARGAWPDLRELLGITESPLLRPDGSVLQAPGYDATTGTLYVPLGTFPAVPEAPTQIDAVKAGIELFEPFSDFPFKGEPDRAATIALILSVVGRSAFEGVSPMKLIDGNAPGAGKGLLADVALLIATGRVPPKMPYSGDHEELRKTITSIAVRGSRVAFFDNVEGRLGTPGLENALTSTAWEDRVLGRTELITLPLRVEWLATGNNVGFRGDMARRVLPIRLESPCERPEERTDFAHADLRAYALRERPRLVVAALTILRSYILAERPDQHVKRWGSFEQRSKLVASAVAWAGFVDLTLARDGIESGDGRKQALDAIIAGLARLASTGSLTAAKILEHVYPLNGYGPPPPPHIVELRTAIESVIPCVPGKVPDARRLGMLLQSYRTRVSGGRRLESTIREDVQAEGAAALQEKHAPSL